MRGWVEVVARFFLWLYNVHCELPSSGCQRLELLHSTALSLLGSGKSEKVSLMFCLRKGEGR